MAERLTDKLVKGLPSPASGNRITYDTEIRGLGLRVTAAGAKSFVLNYRASGRERRYTIGSYPDWSVVAAREEAKRLKRAVDLGQDPMGDRHVERAAPSVTDLAQRYLDEHAARKAPRAREDDRAMLEKLVLPELGRMKVYEVRQEHLDRLHREVSQTRPIRANRILQLCSKMFSLAIRWGYRADNPTKGWHSNHEPRRTRYITPNELARLNAALVRRADQPSAAAVRLLLLTGARRGEVLGATWDQFDLKVGVWIKPSAHTKQRKEHRVPLSDAAVQLLNDLRGRANGSPYLFPGRGLDGPQQDLKGFWAGLSREVGLENCRLHDLRHTYASILASAGMSLPIIGALLGHTQPNTTARYSHLFDDPLREATERVSASLAGTAAA